VSAAAHLHGVRAVVRSLDKLIFEAGAFHVLDRGYMDFKRVDLLVRAGAFFVTRAKDDLRFSRTSSQPVDQSTALRSDQISRPTLPKARSDFPSLLRKVRSYDSESAWDLVFLTNNLSIQALNDTVHWRAREDCRISLSPPPIASAGFPKA
jgi:hypothetical protein